MKICYLVLVYNNITDTIETLESILSQEMKVDILVIDNNSKDSCKEVVQDFCLKHENIKYIYRDINDGYAGGNNYGWTFLRKDYDYVFVVNNDIIINDKKLTKKLIDLFFLDESISIAGPRVLVGNNEDFPEAKINKLFFYKLQQKKYLNTEKYQEKHSILGCFLAIKTTAVQEDYLFDESLFMYGEELDLCLRMWKAGKKVVCIKDESCSIYHKGGYSSYTRGKPWIYYLSIRNAVLSSRNINYPLKIVYLILYVFSFFNQLCKLKQSSPEARALKAGFKKGIFFLLSKVDKNTILNDSLLAINQYAR